MFPELTARRVDVTERGPGSRLPEKLLEKGPTEKVHRRRSAGESPLEKVCWRRFVEEGPPEKVRGRRLVGEGPREKRDVVGKVGCRKRGLVGNVALIPCEEKNNSVIFIH